MIVNMNLFTDLFQDPTIIKSSKWTMLGFIIGKIGIETVDIYSRVILQCCGIVAFGVTVIVALPKIVEFISKLKKIFGDAFSKVLKAIKTTINDKEN